MYAINSGIIQQLFVATTDTLQRSIMLTYFFFQEGPLRFLFFFNIYLIVIAIECCVPTKIVFLLNSTAELQLE
jgi:hypothetical protein